MKMNKKEKTIIYVMCFILASIIAFGTGIFIANNKNKISSDTTQLTDTSEQIQNPITTTTISDATNETYFSTTETTQPETKVMPVILIPGTPDEPAIIGIDNDFWYLTLVNSSHKIPETYTPDLVAVCGTQEKLDRKIALEYEKMYAAACVDGVHLKPCSGYRSYELQEKNHNNKIKFFENQGYSTEEAKAKASEIIMPPGSSEHNLGYAMDIVCVDEWFENTKEFRWLTENAADYGFIMRYPKDKQHITKVIYEPWHWRYVGVDAAKEMKEKNLTLEEYLGVY